jgi:type II secretory pathway pseudopilin PulG
MRRHGATTDRRNGFSYLELQVALVLFAFALAGLGPLLIVQSRQARHLEEKLAAGTTQYFVPSDDPWVRKLGAAAGLETTAPPTTSPPVTLIDDADPQYSETGAESDWSSQLANDAVAGHMRYHEPGDGSAIARWQFTQITPGWHEILVTYDANSPKAKANDAPFTIYDGEVPIATVLVAQKHAATGNLFVGLPWKSLGVFPITSDALRVELSNNADNSVVADAVRIVRRENDVQLISVNKSFDGDNCTAATTVTVQVP